MTALSTRADAAGSEKCSSRMTVRMGASLLVRERLLHRLPVASKRVDGGRPKRRIEPPRQLPATNDHRHEPAGAEPMIIKVVIAVVILLVGTVVASNYFDFNP